MKKSLISLSIIGLSFIACHQVTTKEMNNPFLETYTTPYGIPPFDQINDEHFEPAFDLGIKELKEEVHHIVNNPEEASFENTILALENSGALIDKVNNVFGNVLGMNTNDSLQAKAQRIYPLLSKCYDEIYLNDSLFQRVKQVYDQKDTLELSLESKKLLDETYKSFVRGGALLEKDQKEELKNINEKLSVLSLKFGDNVLAETNAFKLVIDYESDLAGLPQSNIDAAAETAISTGDSGKWVFTIQKPSMIPFLQYAEKRDLREKIFKAYINKGDNNNEYDNKENLKEMVQLRFKRAQLLGYKNHAEYILDENMAKTPATVYAKINSLMEKALVVAEKEAKELQSIIDAEGNTFKLEAWDWWYYAEKVKKEKYDFDENELRPYFELNNTLSGLFMVADKLYGLKFEAMKDVPVPHPDAVAYKVKEADDSMIGILFMDFYPRKSKQGGAWMSSYRKQYKANGENQMPLITMVCNFTKPTGDTPALLSVEEVNTLFHEFGHALHGLLSKCTYKSLSGTSVARDFVELPSQIMENWAVEPEVLKLFAKHYQSGEVIPDELISKFKNSSLFNQGFETVEYMAAAIIDMDYHTCESSDDFNVLEFEKQSIANMKLMPEIELRYRSTYFNHIFSGGYSSGYYSYIWAEILDADAYDYFLQNGVFDKAIATSFRKNILEKGGTEDPMKLYLDFRGQEPDETALLKRRGLM